MMVRDKNGHSKLLCMGNLRDSRNSVVTGDNRVDAVLLRCINQMLIDSVAVLHPVRYLIVHLSPTAGNSAVKDVSRHHTVDIR